MKKTKETKQNSVTLIKKSNEFIESHYMFDIWETRFFLSVLSLIHKTDVDFQTYRIQYKDLIKTFGLKSNSSYENLRNAAKSIMDKKVAIAYEEDGIVRETLYHLIRKVDYAVESSDGKRKAGQEYIDVSVDPDMKPFLLQLQKNFTAYDLRNVVRLGVYPIRIYELLKQYQNFKYRKLTIEELKKMFGLTHEYPRYSNFYQKIIQPAINEINEYTDLYITDVEKIKKGKNIIALGFTFKAKNQEDISYSPDLFELEKPKTNLVSFSVKKEIGEEWTEIAMEDDSNEEEDEKNRLFSLYQQTIVNDYKVAATTFLKYLEDKTEEDVKKAIRMTNQARKNGEINNLAGYFIDALRNKYTNEKEDKIRKNQLRAEKVILIEEELKRLYEEQARVINDKIRSLRDTQPSLTQEMINQVEQNPYLQIFLDGKKAKLGRNLIIEDYRQDIELRKLVKQGFIERFKADFILLTKQLDEEIKVLEEILAKFKM